MAKTFQLMSPMKTRANSSGGGNTEMALLAAQIVAVQTAVLLRHHLRHRLQWQHNQTTRQRLANDATDALDWSSSFEGLDEATPLWEPGPLDCSYLGSRGHGSSRCGGCCGVGR
mmetsp:Transcript_33050/g.65091  ORF Transcript_33050/g.65091 Transcript_33050/m.65091 type:complete len:114 (-) Transcript_33050:143-484(-)